MIDGNLQEEVGRSGQAATQGVAARGEPPPAAKGSTPSPPATAYRYEWRRYAPPVDEFDRPTGAGRAALELHSYEIQSETRCGFWITVWCGTRRFVRAGAKRQFAHKTKQEALASFRKRRERYLAILEARRLDALESLLAADNEQPNQSKDAHQVNPEPEAGVGVPPRQERNLFCP
jgi:hypothetical protein